MKAWQPASSLNGNKQTQPATPYVAIVVYAWPKINKALTSEFGHLDSYRKCKGVALSLGQAFSLRVWSSGVTDGLAAWGAPNKIAVGAAPALGFKT